MLDAESKENVAARVLLRMNATERHRGKKHEVRSIIQMQARLAASALRGLRDIPAVRIPVVKLVAQKESLQRRAEATAGGQRQSGGVAGVDL